MKNDNEYRNPPRIAEWILERVYLKTGYHTRLGDYGEIYNDIVRENNIFFGWIWYWFQVVTSVCLRTGNSILWSVIMLMNYLKIAFRNIMRYKGYSFINISGLAVGMACCIVISLWILQEFQYDAFHENADNLYGIVNVKNDEGGGSSKISLPVPLAPALIKEFPEVTAATRYYPGGQILLKYQDKIFYEKRSYFVDPSFLQMFSYNFISGDLNTALNDPYSIIITEDIADKYFAEESPVGKSIDFNDEYELIVTGVMENVPDNSSMQFEILLPYALRDILDKKERYRPSWWHNRLRTYVQLQEKSSPELAGEKITDYYRQQARSELGQYITTMENSGEIDKLRQQADIELDRRLVLEPLKNIRLSRHYGGTVRARYLSVFATIAFAILLIACINFMNLSTARSAVRAKEIGLRKVVGASRKNIVWQFLGESFLLSFAAIFIAVFTVLLLLPAINNLFQLKLQFNLVGNSFILPVLIGIALFTGLAGGSYPALILSSFQPVRTLKGDLKSGTKGSVMRKSLVVIQLTLSVFLIFGTVVIYKQLDYVKSKDLGYEKEHVICIPLNSGSLPYFDTMKSRLLSDSRILSVSGIHQKPTWISSTTSAVDWDSKNPALNVRLGNFRVNYDYVKTMSIQLVAGRDFSKDFSADEKNSFVVNEEVVKLMGLKNADAVGKRLMFNGDEGTIIGDVKNFHYLPLGYSIQPMAMHLMLDRTKFLLVSVVPSDVTSTVDFIRKTWMDVMPSFPFEYSFLDSDYDALYRSEENSGVMLRCFTLLAILIACLGIFGLASYTAEQRTKEIGIRKILGASVPNILNLMSKEFLLLALLSNVAAWPFSYYLMNGWLENYAYRTSIDIWTFILPAFITIVLTMLTVAFQAMKAANVNPVVALKYE